MNMEHDLDCKKGGLVIKRCNKVRDALGDITAMAYRSVLREPIVREADLEGKAPALIADLGGSWGMAATD